MQLRYHVLDVFTDRAFGGNPLAVVFGGDRLAGRTMQKVAAEFNLSETVFVLPPTRPSATRRARIFTPRTELPFAGHPTVGTAFLLASLGECDLAVAEPAIVLEEGIGDVRVAIRLRQGVVVGAQMSVPKMPERGPQPPAPEKLAQMLSLGAADMHPELAPQAWSCGVPFLFVALKDLGAVQRAKLRPDLWAQLLEGCWAASVFVFTFPAVCADAQIHARMFAPAFGIAEDPATGAAVAALAGLSRQRAARWPPRLGRGAGGRDGPALAYRAGMRARRRAVHRRLRGRALGSGRGGRAAATRSGVSRAWPR